MNEDGFTIEWPLWGMRLVDRPSGLEGGILIDGFWLYQPTWQQWDAMEKHDVVVEYAGNLLGAEWLGNATQDNPPVCLLALSSQDNNGDPDPTFTEQQRRARNLFDALRIYSPGDFIDPAETGTYFSSPGSVTFREVQVFRSAFYGSSMEDPYLVDEDDVEPIASLASWIRELRFKPMHTSAVLALENFSLSFGLAMNDAERALHRFMALEALLGQIRKSNAAAFAARATNAVGDATPEFRSWLASAFKVRNGVAHNLSSTAPSAEDLNILEDVARAVLHSYIRHISVTDSPHPLKSFNDALAKAPIANI